VYHDDNSLPLPLSGWREVWPAGYDAIAASCLDNALTILCQIPLDNMHYYAYIANVFD